MAIGDEREQQGERQDSAGAQSFASAAAWDPVVAKPRTRCLKAVQD